MSSIEDQKVAERIWRVENGIPAHPILRGAEHEGRSLAELMEQTHVPGLSVAVINEGRIEWARGYGVREAGRPEPVTTETIFQIGSVSKPVAVVGALRMVQDGRLELDEDVNSYLKSWKVRGEAGWQPRVTLRQLLCHGGGTTQHGFPGYLRDDALPTVQQVLDGEPPANTGPVRVNAVPGTQFRYSGGGTTIVQLLMSEVAGMPFPQLMRGLVFVPLGMEHSTYEQPLPEEWHDRAAAGHYTDGVPVVGRWHVYPEMAAAGLWSTASDLALLAIDIQRARAGKPGTLLEKSIVDEMLTPQVEGFIGLGFFLRGEGENLRFTHEGDDAGFKAVLTAYAERGQGAVILTNGDEAPWLVYPGLLRAIAREYVWPNDRWREPETVAVPAEKLRAYVGVYELQPDFRLIVSEQEGALYVQPTGQNPFQLYPTSESRFFARAVNVEIEFESDGDTPALVFKQNDAEMRAEKQLSILGPGT